MATMPIIKIVGNPAAPGSYPPNAMIQALTGDGYDLWVVNNDATDMVRMNGAYQHVALTQAQYDALDPPDPNTFYNIIEA